MLNSLEVMQVTIPLPFRLNHVNCFLAQGENGWTIMDTGLNNETSRNTWEPLLAKYDIKNIILTHYHPDHFGYAGDLQQLTDAEVWMTEVDEKAGKTSWENHWLDEKINHYFICGIPDETAIILNKDERSFQSKVTPYPIVNHHLEEGMKIQFGKYEYEVLHTPGHSDGLISLYNKEKGILFSTDHVLEKITPNISYWFHGDNNPLGAFFKSLKKMQLLNVEYIIPSHGKPFTNLEKRIEELFDHHNFRLNEVYKSIQGPSTVFEVCNRTFKNLSVHDTRFAIGETLSHLNYLMHYNQCKKELSNGIWYFQAI